MPARGRPRLDRGVINARASIHAKRVHEVRAFLVAHQAAQSPKVQELERGKSCLNHVGRPVEPYGPDDVCSIGVVCPREAVSHVRIHVCARAPVCRSYACMRELRRRYRDLPRRKREGINSPVLILTDSTTKWLVAWFHQSARVITGVPRLFVRRDGNAHARAGTAWAPSTFILWVLSFVTIDWRYARLEDARLYGRSSISYMSFEERYLRLHLPHFAQIFNFVPNLILIRQSLLIIFKSYHYICIRFVWWHIGSWLEFNVIVI